MSIDIVISKAVPVRVAGGVHHRCLRGPCRRDWDACRQPAQPAAAALAAAVVAVAFQPVRQWAGRLANRVVYGRRATPYQVLSDFAQRIGGTYAAEDVLPQMAQIVAAGTGAKR
jgi:hypothetical protein